MFQDTSCPSVPHLSGTAAFATDDDRPTLLSPRGEIMDNKLVLILAAVLLPPLVTK